MAGADVGQQLQADGVRLSEAGLEVFCCRDALAAAATGAHLSVVYKARIRSPSEPNGYICTSHTYIQATWLSAKK
jgi:hypothetical protein